MPYKMSTKCLWHLKRAPDKIKKTKIGQNVDANPQHKPLQILLKLPDLFRCFTICRSDLKHYLLNLFAIIFNLLFLFPPFQTQ